MVRYLALTAGELHGHPKTEEKIAYMACHFSPYTTGLSNLPEALPPDSMLILNDRIPISGHDPQRIADQLQQALEQLSCDSILLDFQRPDKAETAGLCRLLAQQLPCPLGISHHYAQDLECSVFLPPPPLDMTLEAHLKPWAGRSIWLEAALEAAKYTVSGERCHICPLPYAQPEQKSFVDDAVHCRYRCEIGDAAISFFLYRTTDQLNALLEQADTLGIEKAIGLYQQLGMEKPLVI